MRVPFMFLSPADPPAGTPPPAPPPMPPAPLPGASPLPAPPAGDPPGPVPYDRFKEMLDARRAAEARLAEIEAAQKTATEKQLADEKRWQELAEARERELKTERLSRLRLEVATKKGLPIELAARLQGDTAGEIEADADALLKLVPKAPEGRGGPGVPPPARGTRPAGPVDFSAMTPAQVREWREKNLK